MFSNCNTVGEIKAEFVRLAIQGVADKGAYLASLEALDGQANVGTDGKTRQYNFKVSLEQKIIDKLASIIAVNPGHWNVELIHLWIWVSGTEKPDARLLGRGTKEKPGLKMHWNPKRKCWQWKPYPGRARFSKKSKDEIAAQYGQIRVAGARA